MTIYLLGRDEKAESEVQMVILVPMFIRIQHI